MARSRASSPRTHSRAAPASHPPAPAHTPASNHPQTPQVTNVYLQRGGGGTGFMGTMLAATGGSVLGHGISNYLYGNQTQAPTQPAEAQSLAKAASEEGHVCAPQLGGYSKCLENNPESADKCKWAWDYFVQCKDANVKAEA